MIAFVGMGVVGAERANGMGEVVVDIHAGTTNCSVRLR